MRLSVTDAQMDEIPGWFEPYDVDMFRLLLAATAEAGPGDLAELGVYLGKSAVLIGSSLADGETFTVVDLFGSTAGTEANQSENDDQYAGLSREAFEANYLRVHGVLPQIVVGPSDSIVEVARHDTHRFVHVDASHLYQHVVGDIEAARTLLRPDGVVVFDDIRSQHTPGVAAAVWQAAAQNLRPFAITPVKLYATFGDPAPLREIVNDWVKTSEWFSETQTIGRDEVVRVWWESHAPEADQSPGVVGSLKQTLGRLIRR